MSWRQSISNHLTIEFLTCWCFNLLVSMYACLFVNNLLNSILTPVVKTWHHFLCCLFIRSMNCIWTSCQFQNFWLRYLMTCEYALNLTLTCITVFRNGESCLLLKNLSLMIWQTCKIWGKVVHGFQMELVLLLELLQIWDVGVVCKLKQSFYFKCHCALVIM
jgi:hypothetical protein